MNFSIESRTIYLALHGSRCYGTHTPESDYDVKGIAIAPKQYHYGFLHRFEQYERMHSNEGGNLHNLRAMQGKDADVVIYSLQKFAKLAMDANPNIIEVLFCDDSDIVQIDDFGRQIRENRDIFISKKARHTFSGYAVAQLKRMNTHRSWLLNPPDHKPTREEYGLEETTKVSKSVLGAFDAVMESGAHKELPEGIMHLYTLEKRYQQAMNYYEQYMHWKETRNPTRAMYEEKYGYDVKHAYHLVRLMRMCVEILEGKGVIVKRPDAEELLMIRNGAWSYEQLIEYANKMDAKAGELYDSSPLRKEPPREKIDELVVSMTETYLQKHG